MPGAFLSRSADAEQHCSASANARDSADADPLPSSADAVQVVNGVHGMHATIPKWMFNASVPSMANGMYLPTVIRGTSQPLAEVMDLSAIMGPSASA